MCSVCLNSFTISKNTFSLTPGISLFFPYDAWDCSSHTLLFSSVYFFFISSDSGAMRNNKTSKILRWTFVDGNFCIGFLFLRHFLCLFFVLLARCLYLRFFLTTKSANRHSLLSLIHPHFFGFKTSSCLSLSIFVVSTVFDVLWMCL